MTTTRKFSLLAICGMVAFGLASCAPAEQQRPPAAQEEAASPIPDVGFSPDVSDAAVNACRTALDDQTDGSIDVVASEFSQANSAVYMVVGAQRAPWRCLVANDGRGPELMFLGDEGKL